MASYADNDIYLSIGGTVVHAYFKSVNLQASNNIQDNTAGAGTDHVERAAGLDDTKITISLNYDADDIATYIQKMRPGARVEIEYGPQGAVSGKPRHVQEFIISGSPYEVNVDKKTPVFEVTGEGAAAPSVNMYAGGVYS